MCQNFVEATKGGLKPMLTESGKAETLEVQKIIQIHEQSHIADLLKINPNAGKDKQGKNLPPGIWVGFANKKDLWKSELTATAESIQLLQKLVLKEKDAKLKQELLDYIKLLQDFHEQMEINLRKGEKR